jgi:hypothetical protein
VENQHLKFLANARILQNGKVQAAKPATNTKIIVETRSL